MLTVVSRATSLTASVPFCHPQVPQEGLAGDALRPLLLCPQPPTLGQSVLPADVDCELQSPLQVRGPLPWGRPGRWGPPVLQPPPPRGPGSRARVHRTQPLLCPVDTGFGGVLRHRSVSPSGLADTAISEEARQGPEEEPEAQRPLPGGTGRRHTLAEVSTFSPCAPPCECPTGRGWCTGRGQGREGPA